MSLLDDPEVGATADHRQVTYVYVTHFHREERRRLFIVDEVQHLFAHFREFRLGVGTPRAAHPVLVVLWGLLSIRESTIKVRLISNSDRSPDFEFLAAMFQRRGDGSEIQFHTASTAIWDDPFQLTWVHKKLMKSDLERAAETSVFVYLEHDQMFLQENLNYVNFCHSHTNSVFWSPDFLRIEWHGDRKDWVFTDLLQKSVRGNPANQSIPFPFFQSPSQYSGMYALSKKQATLHFELPSSSLERLRECIAAREMTELYGLRASELAALGGRYDPFFSGEDRWEGFSSSTSFIPVTRPDGAPPLGAFSWHVSNNYARKRRFRRVPYGSVPVADLAIHGWDVMR